MSPLFNFDGSLRDEYFPYSPGCARDEIWVRGPDGINRFDEGETKRLREMRRQEYAERVARQREDAARAVAEVEQAKEAALVAKMVPSLKAALQASGDFAAGEELQDLRRDAEFGADTRQRLSGFGKQSGDSRQREYRLWRQRAAQLQKKRTARGLSRLSNRQVARLVREELDCHDSVETIRKHLDKK